MVCSDCDFDDRKAIEKKNVICHEKETNKNAPFASVMLRSALECELTQSHADAMLFRGTNIFKGESDAYAFTRHRTHSCRAECDANRLMENNRTKEIKQIFGQLFREISPLIQIKPRATNWISVRTKFDLDASAVCAQCLSGIGDIFGVKAWLDALALIDRFDRFSEFSWANRQVIEMNKADLYQRSNGLQRRDARQVLEEFSSMLQWRENGRDSVLDVGCGSGDVTIDYLLPLLPMTFSRLVGSDLSEQMIRYARDVYKHPNIEFEKLDISGDVDKFLSTFEPFDHVTSFYCLHWVQNQKKAIQNIFNLLRPEGDCLLVFLANNPIFDVYKRMAESNKWSQYMADVHRFISPYQYSSDPAADFGALLYSVGFTEYSVEVRDKMYTFEGIDLLKSQLNLLVRVIFLELIGVLVDCRVRQSSESISGADTKQQTGRLFGRLHKNRFEHAVAEGHKHRRAAIFRAVQANDCVRSQMNHSRTIPSSSLIYFNSRLRRLVA